MVYFWKVIVLSFVTFFWGISHFKSVFLCRNMKLPFKKGLFLFFSFIGTIGFFACFWFVTKIYSVVKVDWRSPVFPVKTEINSSTAKIFFVTTLSFIRLIGLVILQKQHNSKYTSFHILVPTKWVFNTKTFVLWFY